MCTLYIHIYICIMCMCIYNMTWPVGSSASQTFVNPFQKFSAGVAPVLALTHAAALTCHLPCRCAVHYWVRTHIASRSQFGLIPTALL